MDRIVCRDDVTEIDPHAEADSTVFEFTGIAADQFALARDGTLDSSQSIGELNQQAISCRTHDVPLELRDRRIDHVDTNLPEASQSSDLVGSDQPGIADHVCGKDGSKTALDAFLGHVV